jgi:hypothetical protein
LVFTLADTHHPAHKPDLASRQRRESKISEAERTKDFEKLPSFDYRR